MDTRISGILEYSCKGQLKECILWKGRNAWFFFQKLAVFSALLLQIGGKRSGSGTPHVDYTGQLGKSVCPKYFVCTSFTLLSLVENPCAWKWTLLISPYWHFLS